MDNPRIYLWIGLALLAWMNLVQWNRDYGATSAPPPVVSAPAAGDAASAGSSAAGQLPALTLAPAVESELRTQYTAAACLQRMWSIRLSFYLGEFQLLPDLYSTSLDLPPVDAHYGKLCLHTLAARQPFDQLPAYDGLMGLLFGQLKAEATHEYATAR
jgi:hypothetical protein